MKFRYLVGIWLVLAAVGAPSSASGEMAYFAVFMEGKKVGHSIQSRVAADGKVTTTEEVTIAMSRLGVPVSMNMTETSIETTDGRPLAFESVQDLSMMKMKVAGTVSKQGVVSVTVSSMGGEQKSTFEWPSGVVMAEGLRLLTLKKGLKEGLEYTTRVFSPGIMQAIDAKILIGVRQDVDLLGRVVALTEIETTMEMPGAGKIIGTSYVDDELRVQKSIMPIGGMLVEMVACAKEFALGEAESVELIDKMFLASPEPLENIGSARSVTYRLSPTAGVGSLTIPSNDNQSVQPGRDGGVIVTVTPAAAPKGVRFPYKGGDRTIVEAMKPTGFLQSDRKEIIELARRAVGDTKDAGQAVRRIESFVADYIENKNLSVGYASAVEVAASRQGDCTEHAVLTAALCRAVGIPAQVVAGVAYVEDFGGLEGFGWHAWTQAYIGGKWIGVDAIFKGAGLGGYGPGHIALAVGNGEPGDFFSLVGILGRFKIDKITVNGGN